MHLNPPSIKPTEPATPLPAECIDIEQVAPDFRARALAEGNKPIALLVYAFLGGLLGVVFTKGQVISWFRIYEMFRFESFHMYGIIGSAVATAALSIWLIRKFNLTTIHGDPIRLSPKIWGESRLPAARYWMGGITFGFGWALLGACPGPLLALIGGGVTIMIAALVAALGGTWTYAVVRDHLPH